MKKKISDFIDRYVLWGAGVIGIGLSVYCVILQSGFLETGHFEYIDIIWCFAAPLIGAIAAYAMIRYFKSEAEKSANARRLNTRDFMRVARGYVLTLILSALLGFFAVEALWALVGAGGLMMSGVFMLLFKLWEIRERKAQQQEKETESGDPYDGK